MMIDIFFDDAEFDVFFTQTGDNEGLKEISKQD
jgi:hypothetical protein